MKTFTARFAPGDKAYFIELERVWESVTCRTCQGAKKLELKTGAFMDCSVCRGSGREPERKDIGRAYQVKWTTLDEITFLSVDEPARYLRRIYNDGERSWHYEYELYETPEAANAAAVERTELHNTRLTEGKIYGQPLLPPLLIINS